MQQVYRKASCQGNNTTVEGKIWRTKHVTTTPPQKEGQTYS